MSCHRAPISRGDTNGLGEPWTPRVRLSRLDLEMRVAVVRSTFCGAPGVRWNREGYGWIYVEWNRDGLI